MVGIIGDLLAAESVAPGTVEPMGIHTERGTPGGMYQCAGEEKWVSIVCRDDADWRALTEVMGRPELGADDRFATLAARRAAVDEVDALVGEWTAGLDRYEVAERCQGAGLAAGPMLVGADMMVDPHYVARGFPVTVDQPGVGEIEFEGPGFRGTAMADPVEEPAPWLGEHTVAICRDVLGLDEAEIERLIAANVLEVTPPA